MEKRPFIGCDALEEIHLPSTLSFLDYSSLRDLPALKEIWINCTYADAQKIANWSSIETLRDPKILIHYTDDAPFSLAEADGCAFKIFEDHAELIYAIDAPADFTIPETVDGQRVTAIADNALRGTDLTSVTIPEGVETIGKSAFSGCKTLTSVTLPLLVELPVALLVMLREMFSYLSKFSIGLYSNSVDSTMAAHMRCSLVDQTPINIFIKS